MFVTDTHPLVWYINGDFSKISEKVRRAFDQTETAETVIYVPAVVLWEIAILEKLGRIRLNARFDRWANDVLSIKPGLRIRFFHFKMRRLHSWLKKELATNARINSSARLSVILSEFRVLTLRTPR